MSSAPFTTDLVDTFQNYISNPSKQLNMGWSAVSVWYVAAVVVGILTVAVSLLLLGLDSDYAKGNKSKKSVLVVAWIGFALIVVGIWLTIGNFYKIVKRIDADVQFKGENSLFFRDNAKNAVAKLGREVAATEGVKVVLSQRRSIAKSNLTPNDDGESGIEYSIREEAAKQGTPAGSSASLGADLGSRFTNINNRA